MKKLILFTIALLLLPTLVLAQTATPAGNACSTVNTGATLGTCIAQIYVWSLGVAALLALVMIVAGGYITLTARGNAEQASKGRNFITSSLIGLVILFGAYLLLRTINPDLTNFQLTIPPVTGGSPNTSTGTGR